MQVKRELLLIISVELTVENVPNNADMYAVLSMKVNAVGIVASLYRTFAYWVGSNLSVCEWLGG